jgi:hypothetical protein
MANRDKIPDKYTELLDEIQKQDTFEAVDEDKGYIKLHTATRRCLRQILWDLNVPNNPGVDDRWIMEMLILGIEKLKKNQKKVD